MTIDDDIAKAERDLEEARQPGNSAQLDAQTWQQVGEYDRIRRLAEQSQAQRVIGAAARLAHLRERKAAADKAVTEHAATEAARAGDVDKLDADLRASRKRVAAAAKAAEKAVTGLLEAAQAHDDLVRVGAAALIEHGLPARDEFGQDYGTGGVGGRNAAVGVRGTWWTSVNPAAVLLRTVRGVARGLYGDRGELSLLLGRIFSAAQAQAVDSRPDGLLADAPSPASFAPPREKWREEYSQMREAYFGKGNFGGTERQRQEILDRQEAEAKAQERRVKVQQQWHEEERAKAAAKAR